MLTQIVRSPRWWTMVVCALCLTGNLAVAQDAGNNKPAADKGATNDVPAVGHLEVLDDPYVPVPPGQQRVTPAVRLQRGPFVAVQVNVDANGNNIVGDAANEPSIAVDPNDPSRMAIGWRQFDTISSNFRQAGWGYTDDGGLTWTFPGRIEAGVFRSDPVLDANADGYFFYNSLTNTPDYHCHVFRSTNGGQTWEAGVYAWGGDKQWQVIDTTDGIGRNNIYATWNSFYSSCTGNFTRSYDGGATFEACTSVPGDPIWGTLAVGPDGELYVSGRGFTIAKSSTMQNSSLPAAWDFTRSVSLDGSIVYSAGPNPDGLGGQAWVAVDHTPGPTRGNVYLLCSVDRNSNSDPADVMFSRSTDGGNTWSAPVRVNDDASTSAWQWFGTMSVGLGGRIDVVWLDTRNDPGGYDSELYYSYSMDAGVTWSANQALTTSFDPHVGWPQQNKMGDYFDMVSDAYGANLAFAGTYNGEQDVYFMRIGDPYCSDAGDVWLDRDRYGCSDTVAITVLDCGLNTSSSFIETVDINIASGTEPGGETVTLTETSAASARFEGTIEVDSMDQPGVLWVTANDTITATYVDADDGQGNYNVTVIATAFVDCTPPVVSNVQAINIEPRSASVTFHANEPVAGTVHYGLGCAALYETATNAALGQDPQIDLTGLQDDTTYYYAVEATDEAGNVTYDDNGGGCYWFMTPGIPDFFTEQFVSGLDIDNSTLFFVPDGGNDYYVGCIEGINELPTNPKGGTTITLSDDDYEPINITGGKQVSLYGTAYTTAYVGSNGYITFTAGDTDTSETFADHFDLPRISALFDDLNPAAGGTVSYKQEADHVAVTYEGVYEYNTTNANTFQIELFFDGTITISYLGITLSDAIAGLSEGNGVSPDFYASDLSAMGPCGPHPPNASNGTATTPWGTPVAIDLIATDDGLPDPPAAMVYKITQLPNHGTLNDPQGGVINSVPYTLVAGGNQVIYLSHMGYSGPDSFYFVADDGGVAPEGGESDEAVISVTVTVPSSQRVYYFPMDSDPGWSTMGLWAYGQPTGGGTHNGDPASGYTGDNVYGYNLDGNYENNLSAQYLTTTALDFSHVAEAELRFWRWLGVERIPYDHARVHVSNDGVNWTMLYANGTVSISESAWSYQTYDISAVADGQPTVYIRWQMGPTDDGGTYPGWNVDDVEIWGALTGPPPMHIVSSVPADGAIDARQPMNPSDLTAQGWSELTLTFDGDVSALVPTFFEVTEICEVGACDGVAPAIANISGMGNEVTLTFDRPIDPVAWTQVAYLGGDANDVVRLGLLPADADASGTSNTFDVLVEVDLVNEALAGGSPAMELADTDRSGTVTLNDILRLIDLLNGTAPFDVYLNAQLPALD